MMGNILKKIIFEKFIKNTASYFFVDSERAFKFLQEGKNWVLTSGLRDLRKRRQKSDNFSVR